MKWPKRQQWLHMQRPNVFLSISTPDLLTMREYHCLLQLLCPDFPLELTQKAARYVSWAFEVNSAPSLARASERNLKCIQTNIPLGENKTDREETGIWRGVYLGFAQKHNTFCISKRKPNDLWWFLRGVLGSADRVGRWWEEEANTHTHTHTHTEARTQRNIPRGHSEKIWGKFGSDLW